MEPHTDAPRAPAPDAVPPQRPGSPPQPRPQPPTGPTVSAHTASATDRGSFCVGVCACGWTGPARRSRDLARRDAAGHEATPTP
ncbi:hypothetical protein ACFCYM_26880 [Streptomyces sp. NPDC056254]|uniref:hypothetical protein n=1 Tax=Streptomyces sp. NPDC056254 TaxID=3345763 RepID=UPI0035D95A91